MRALISIGIAAFIAGAIALSGAIKSDAQTPVLGAVQVVQSAAAEKSHLLKSTPGYLLSLRVNITTVNGWVLLYDLTAAPVDGTVAPRWCETIAGNATLGTAVLNFPTPLRFPSNGIVAVFSSTGCLTQTGSNALFYAQVQ
jgi:hypothetical protein